MSFHINEWGKDIGGKLGNPLVVDNADWVRLWTELGEVLHRAGQLEIAVDRAMRGLSPLPPTTQPATKGEE